MKLNRWFKKPLPTSLFHSSTQFSPLEVLPNPTLNSPTEAEIKLAVITQFFPPDFAATGQLLEELVRHLSYQGIDVEVFTGQPGYAFETAKAPAAEQLGAIRLRRSRSSQLFPQRIRGKALNGVLFSIRAGLHLFRIWRNRNVILLTTAPPFLPIIGYLAHCLLGISYVCLLYDLYPDIAVQLDVVPADHWLARFWRTINREIWRKSRGIIVLSPAMRQRIINQCPDVADKVSVIHSWADPQRIEPIAKAQNWFARKHQLVEPFTVLYSGNMGRCHDLDTILETAKLLQDEPVQFVFIGGGAKRANVMEQAQQLGLSNLLFLPYQDKTVLPYSLTACDLSLVSMSPDMEGLVAPSKLYAALSAARPIAVICPSHSYLRRLILDAECGAVFGNGEAKALASFIRFLKDDRQQAEQMGKAGRRYLKTYFTPETIAQQYHEVLQRAATGKGTVKAMSHNHKDTM